MYSISHEGEVVFNKITSLYFYAPWVPQNKKMEDIILKIESMYGFVFYRINIDNFKNYKQLYNITSLPTIIIFSFEKEIDRVVGLPLTKPLKKIYADIYNQQ